jgi:hypothetical protein
MPPYSGSFDDSLIPLKTEASGFKLKVNFLEGPRADFYRIKNFPMKKHPRTVDFRKVCELFNKRYYFLPLILLAVYLLTSGTGRAQTWNNTPFIVTTDDPGNIWLTFSSGFTDSGSPQTTGSNTITNFGTPWQTYHLTDLLAPVSGVPYLTTPQYTFSLNDYNGRIYISYGGALSSAPTPGTPGTVPYSVIEMTVNGLVTAGVDSSNIDLSYVDGVSAPVSTAIRSGSTGLALPATSVNPVTTQANILSNVAAMVPAGAQVLSSSNVLLRVMSSAAAPSAYHTWTSLMTDLQTTTGTAALNVSSYSSPGGVPYSLGGALFGYSGAPALAVQAANFQNKQNYNTTATFTANLNPTNDPTLAGLGITNGTQGVIITGSGAPITGGGTPAGTFSIYITQTNLNAGTGIYGENPAYVVVPASGTAYATTGIANDLGGRIVGDLLAGMVFGWSKSTVNIISKAAAIGMNLYGTTFSSATVGGLSTGEYFYLLSLAGAQGKLTDWIGASIDSNAQDYDPYLAAIASNSNAYGSGFGDRLQGYSNPNTYWYTSNPPVDPNTLQPYATVGYVEINLASVPEPSSGAFLMIGAGAILGIFRRRIAPAFIVETRRCGRNSVWVEML